MNHILYFSLIFLILKHMYRANFHINIVFCWYNIIESGATSIDGQFFFVLLVEDFDWFKKMH
jgi:hypothetical protein